MLQRTVLASFPEPALVCLLASLSWCFSPSPVVSHFNSLKELADLNLQSVLSKFWHFMLWRIFEDAYWITATVAFTFVRLRITKTSPRFVLFKTTAHACACRLVAWGWSSCYCLLFIRLHPQQELKQQPSTNRRGPKKVDTELKTTTRYLIFLTYNLYDILDVLAIAIVASACSTGISTRL